MTYTLPKKYLSMNETEVSARIADKSDSQIMQELACLVERYSKQVARLLQQGGDIKDMLSLPTCALEKLALRMVIDAVQLDAGGKYESRGA